VSLPDLCHRENILTLERARKLSFALDRDTTPRSFSRQFGKESRTQRPVPLFTDVQREALGIIWTCFENLPLK
jgi:hypothetical protein